MTPEFSVVIASKDRAGALERAIASLQLQQDAPPFEIVVVDNGSNDATAAMLERCETALAPLRRLYEPEPNRGKARNRGAALAAGRYLLFCDDDVWAPAGWVRAHAAAQRLGDAVVNGPILNVASYDARPHPTFANYSRAFLCTCNVSIPREAFTTAGGFDEGFELYGWEDTELGVRLRERGARWRFAWEAFLWHVKPPTEHTLELEARKTVEKAKMARRFLDKHPSRRARLATGAHPVNLFRARYLTPDAMLAIYAGLSTSKAAPAWLREVGRAQFLDGIYAKALVRALGEAHER